MKFGHKRKNQNANYLCNNWMHYEKNLDSLQPAEVLNAKYLLMGLQKLTQEERLYLASQYRNPSGKRYTDGAISEIMGISIKDHRKNKNDILTKLEAALLELHAVLEEDSYKAFMMDRFRRTEALG